MFLTKKQVKALLKVLGDDDSRPLLQQFRFNMTDKGMYITATNSYVLAAYKIGDEHKMLDGYCVARDDLTKWYKLASAKDVLDLDELIQMSTVGEGRYPKWATLVPEGRKEIKSITFNADLLQNLQVLAGQPMEISFTEGSQSPILLNDKHTENVFILMPLKN